MCEEKHLKTRVFLLPVNAGFWQNALFFRYPKVTI